MKIDVRINFDQREAPLWATTLREIASQILSNQENIMATLDELNAALGAISPILDKIAADTENLLTQLANIPPGGLTPEQQAAIDSAVASATSISDRLKAIDDRVPDVAPPA
jgi:hypothetical protein